MELVRKIVPLGDDNLIIESGLFAPRANGAVVLRYKNTVMLATASFKRSRNEYRKPFLALTVDFVENFYASGKIPGGFTKREGKPSTDATLNARVIDRSIRPLFEKNFFAETHVVVSVLSYDKSIDLGALGIIGASSALLISEIPFHNPVAALNIGFDGTPILGANKELNLVVAGTEKSIVMVEAHANEISEKAVVECIGFAHKEMQSIIKIQKELAIEIGKEKLKVKQQEEELVNIEELERRLEELSCSNQRDKADRAQEMIAEYIDNNYKDAQEEILLSVEASCHEVVKKAARRAILGNGERMDGRSPDEIREINIVVDLLPMAHGSALFMRGQTQSLGTTTLGSMDDQQLIDNLEEEFKKRFFLHYNFPPYSTGEAGYLRSPGRRELGHGNLAERAFLSVLPDETEFPYTIRVVSDIISSNGSSSMASVCSASLSLMSAGVPVKSAVAGIAMGLILEDKNHVILTDITGFEDGIGDMDFKVAGTEKGITALQMDIKLSGLESSILLDALLKAQDAKKRILIKMNDVIAKSKGELPENVPRYSRIQIAKEKISLLIGPSGRNIKAIIEKTGSNINIEDDGRVDIFATDLDSLNKTLSLINELVKDLEVGDIFAAKVKKIIASGAFLELTKSKDGFLHISEFSSKRIDNLESHVTVGEIINVKVVNIDDQTGRIRLKKHIEG